jgi:hypothetical protein
VLTPEEKKALVKQKRKDRIADACNIFGSGGIIAVHAPATPQRAKSSVKRYADIGIERTHILTLLIVTRKQMMFSLLIGR